MRVSTGSLCPSLVVVWVWPRKVKDVARGPSRCCREGEEQLNPNQELPSKTRPKVFEMGEVNCTVEVSQLRFTHPLSLKVGYLLILMVNPGNAETQAEPTSSVVTGPCSRELSRLIPAQLPPPGIPTDRGKAPEPPAFLLLRLNT